MSARITRELLGPLLGARHACCHSCGARIAARQGYYQCRTCGVHCCLACSQQGGGGAPANRPAALLLPRCGDILLTGPCLTVHHVILACSDMEPASPSSQQSLDSTEGSELYSCVTVESTPFCTTCLQGDRVQAGADGERETWETHWHRVRSFFRRNVENGSLSLIGTMPLRSQGPPRPVGPLAVKVLSHPFRDGHGSSLDLTVFDEAVQVQEMLSKRYSAKTAVRALLADRGCIEPAAYPDFESRLALLAEIRRRWQAKPICASVAIKVWQHYLELLAGRQDSVVQHILRWMPVFADTTTPSALVKALTACGWELRNHFA